MNTVSASFSVPSWLTDNDACREFLAGLRWPNGFVCPQCSNQGFWLTKRGEFFCQAPACRHQASIKAGTALHGSNLPVSTLLQALWLWCGHSGAVSAVKLQRDLRVTYRTALRLLQVFRRAAAKALQPLRGTVQVDAVRADVLGLRTTGWHDSSQPVIIMVENRDGRPGSVVLTVTPDDRAETVNEATRVHLAKADRVVASSRWRLGWAQTMATGAVGLHTVGECADGCDVALLPLPALVAEHLQQRIAIVYRGMVQPRYLPDYLSGCAFWLSWTNGGQPSADAFGSLMRLLLGKAEDNSVSHC